ncbi:MAG: HAMP domain-containing histidine kinase, partial [Thermoguttaceae bacterium]|nr:HAMP domain-containing histidine kinase [Thermoguttaceae bacterium]
MAPNFDNSRYDEAFEQRVIDCLAEFAAGAGHELNNPLAIISGIAQRLLSDETDLKKRTDLAKVIAQTKRAFEMIADIRGFARPPKPELTLINASDFFNEWTVRESRREISKNVKIEILPSDAGEIEIKTDEAILATALGAIGKNAAEAVS